METVPLRQIENGFTAFVPYRRDAGTLKRHFGPARQFLLARARAMDKPHGPPGALFQDRTSADFPTRLI